MGGAERVVTFLVGLLLAASIAPGAAAAQPERRGSLGWSGSADLGFTLTQGNSETTNLSLGLELRNEGRRQRWSVSGSFVRSTADGEETASQGAAGSRYDRFPSERLFVFGRVRASFNRAAGLDLRLAPEAGAGYVVVDAGSVGLSVRGGLSFISERFESDSTVSALFGSVGEELSLKVSGDTELAQVATYSPRTEKPGDYLLHLELALTTALAGPVGLKLRVVDEFDSSPFVDKEGVARKRNDVALVTGITVRF